MKGQARSYLPNIVEMSFEDKKASTPIGRLSYPNILEPRTNDAGDKSYSADVKILKSDVAKGAPGFDAWQKLLKAVNNAKIEKFGEDKTKWPKNLHMPIKDGADMVDKDPLNVNYYIVRTSSKTKPDLFNNDGRIISDIDEIEDKFQAGYKTKLYVLASVFNYLGKKGVTLSLQGVQFAGKAEKFGGRRVDVEKISAEDELRIAEGIFEEEMHGELDSLPTEGELPF